MSVNTLRYCFALFQENADLCNAEKFTSSQGISYDKVDGLQKEEESSSSHNYSRETEASSTSQMPLKDAGQPYEAESHKIDDSTQYMHDIALSADNTDKNQPENSLVNNVRGGQQYFRVDQTDGVYQENFTGQENQVYNDYNGPDQTQPNMIAEPDSQHHYNQNENSFLASSHNSDVSAYPTPRLNDNNLQNEFYQEKNNYNTDQSSETQAPQLFNPGQFQQPVYTPHNQEGSYSPFVAGTAENTGKKCPSIGLLY